MNYFIFIFLTFTALSSYGMDNLLYYVGYTSTATHNLYVAASNDDVSAAQDALKAGARVNARDEDYETPLHVAATNGHHCMVSVLLLSDAFIDAQNKDGDTPLHLAARLGYTLLAESLIVAGANVYIKNKADKTVVDIDSNLKRRATGLTLKQEDNAKKKIAEREALTRLFARSPLIVPDVAPFIAQYVVEDPCYKFNQ
ncbi:ankyrin repeat domain-containing protein [Candidatus Dependentiae bacterium]|nr:ankyrin repeat domain-containing protein [Candidatus Dependentiae bacterium]